MTETSNNTNSNISNTTISTNNNSHIQQEATPTSISAAENDDVQITHVLNRDKKYLSEHGQKLFNAINVLLDEDEQLELTQALFKYQREHNVFTLVRSCRELFDTPRKKSLMLFMRPVIPMRDRFHYDEYYKLFFPEEFKIEVKSIFTDLIPKDLLEKTLKKANEKKKANLEKEKSKEQGERLNAIKLLEQVNYDLNVDLQKLMSQTTLLPANEIDPIQKLKLTKIDQVQSDVIQIAGFRIIDLAPQENESLGFDICLGPTGTFIMISYVDPCSLVEKLGMKIGDELVSVNDISFKMIDIEQAIDVLSTEPTLRIVLQTSGFMPEEYNGDERAVENEKEFEKFPHLKHFEFLNEWSSPFGYKTKSPLFENKPSLKRHIRRISLRPKLTDTGLGIKIRGGIEHSLGVFISYVEPHSSADLIGLKVSDQIIQVNGQTFSRISSEDALFILKTSLINYQSNRFPIKMTIRYLGKLPLLKQLENKESTHFKIDQEILSDISINNQKPQEQTINSSLASLFDSKNDINYFKFLLNQYQTNLIDIKYFVFLLVRKFKSIKNKLLTNDYLSSLVKNNDLTIFKNLIDNKNQQNDEVCASKDVVYESRIFTNEFKNGLIVRSTEVLNDFNINSNAKSTKYDGFFLDRNVKEDQASVKILSICKSLENLDLAE